jgi:hypothetical protein
MFIRLQFLMLSISLNIKTKQNVTPLFFSLILVIVSINGLFCL